MQKGDSVKEAVQVVPTAQPCIVVRGGLHAIKDSVGGGKESDNYFPAKIITLGPAGCVLCI